MVQQHKSTLAISARVILAAMGNIYFGYSLAYYAITQNSIVQILGYQNSDNKATLDGIINAMVPIGAAVGAFLSSFIVQKYGIRKSFMICDCIGILIVIGSLKMNFYSIIITRFLYGVIVGVNSAIDPYYIQKMSPSSLLQKLGALSNSMLVLGITFAFILSWIFLTNDPSQYDSQIYYGVLGFNSWRVLFGFPAITCLTRLIAFGIFYKQDLPQEYMVRGEEKEAKSLIQSIYKDQYVQEIMKDLQSDLVQQGSQVSTYGDLFKRDCRKNLLVACILSLLNQWSGINAINFYAFVIFSEISVGNPILINILTVLCCVVGLLVAAASGPLINKFGCRIILLVGNGMCFFSLSALTFLYMVITIYQDYLSMKDYDLLQIFVIISIFLFVVAYNLSLGPVFWILIPQILPSKGIGIVVVQNWISLALLAQFFPMIAAKASVYVCFSIFAFVCFLGQCFIAYNVMDIKIEKPKDLVLDSEQKKLNTYELKEIITEQQELNT